MARGFVFGVFLTVVISSYAKQCFDKDICETENKAFKYTKESNIYLQQIEEAVKFYKPCTENDCQCYESVIDADLKPFKDGVTKEMIDFVSDRGTKYQIYNHKLYRSANCMFPARCAGIEYFIKPLLPELPNMEMIINCRDWPQVNYQFSRKGPVFSFSKTDEFIDIMYPAWAFWEGGPAISLYPTGIGRWDKHIASITEAAKNTPWSKKNRKAFFRGSRTADERDALIRLSRKNKNIVDAQYTKNQAWKSPKDTLNAEPAKEVSFEDHCKYRYLFNFRGVAASFRFKHLFLCRSLVFHVGDEWKEFFYSAMKPWVHFVPVRSNPTDAELQSLIEFFKRHDDLAQEIADRGYQFIIDHLRMEDVECYWRKLLKKYSNLIKFDVILDESLIAIK